MGAVEFEDVSTSISNIPKKKKLCYIYERRNTKYWQKCFDPRKLSRNTKYSVGESTVRLQRKQYEQGLASSTKVKCGRLLLLGLEIDEKVMKFLQAIPNQRGVVNTVVAIAIAQALIVKSEDKTLKVLDLEKTSWTKGLFHRMGFANNW